MLVLCLELLHLLRYTVFRFSVQGAGGAASSWRLG